MRSEFPIVKSQRLTRNFQHAPVISAVMFSAGKICANLVPTSEFLIQPHKDLSSPKHGLSDTRYGIACQFLVRQVGLKILLFIHITGNIKEMGVTVVFGAFEWDYEKDAENRVKHGIDFYTVYEEKN